MQLEKLNIQLNGEWNGIPILLSWGIEGRKSQDMGEQAPRLLLVDDEVIILTHLEEMLESSGYSVAGKAPSAAEAVRLARELQPDLVIMDIVMPGEMDGIDACERIQGELGIPVVLLTAYANPQYITRAKHAHPYGYILKPYQNEQVVAAVEMALEKKELDRRIEKAFQESSHEAENRGVQLREIHHRVKNHLNMISSFLTMKAMDVTDRECSETLEEINSRVRTVARIHEQLYRSGDIMSINCREYLEALVESFRESLDKTGNIEVELDIIDHTCPSDKVMLVGLIVSELFSNAVKHAFPKGRGVVRVGLFAEDHTATLEVADNGVGLPPDVDTDSPSSFGLGLVQALARQLGSRMQVETGNGTAFRFEIPLE